MLIGYARVSTADQNLDLQMDALKAAGCEQIFTDTASGARSQRPGLAEALSHCRKGDTFAVWRLDRLGRTVKGLIEFTQELGQRGVAFRSLNESIDTSKHLGKFFFHLMAALAEMERDLIRERTNAGLTAARARGRTGGRPRKVDDRKLATALAMLDAPGANVRDVAHALGVAPSTIYRALGRTNSTAAAR